MAHTDQALISKRASSLEGAYNDGNVEKLLAFYTEDIDFSDHVMHIEHLNFENLKGFFQFMYTALSGLKCTTNGLNGTAEFTAHEMTLEFTTEQDTEPLGAKKGDKLALKGVLLSHWKEVNGKWKIFKEDDYFHVHTIEHKAS